jgi:flagellar hook-associated protein 1 FlgK
MGTLTALLNLSQNALNANQTALDITSNNVANANTPGYTDEIATWQENDSVQLSANAKVGEGASVTALSQRNLVLNQQVNIQTQLQASSSAQSSALNDLQSIFGITTTSTSSAATTLGTDMNAFYASLSSLQANPADSSVRQNVLSAANTLAMDFNTASSQITQQTSSLNQQATGAVSKINSLTSSIASLNLQIEASSPQADAGTLEDQRQQDLTQLSQYIGFSQTRTESNGLTLTTADGTPLVSDGQSYPLNTSIVNGNADVISALGQNITPVLNGTVSGITGGSLGGILQARDQDLPTVSTALDSLAYAVGSAVNEVNENGLDANGNPGEAIFNLPVGPAGAASTISVATSSPNAIAAAALNEGSSGGTNATALNTIVNDPLMNGQTASQFYASLLTQLGNTVSGMTNENTTQQASLTQLTTQQSSLSSVSLDQEASNLTLYERSYQAASKVFTIVDELMASALNLGEETTVS